MVKQNLTNKGKLKCEGRASALKGI